MTEAEPLPAPIDLEDLRARASGDRIFALELLHLFSNDFQARLDRMTAALDTGDARRIELDAHALSGASASLGAALLSHLAERLETAAAHRHLLDEAPTLLADIRNEYNRLRSHLKRQGWELPAPHAPGTTPGPANPDKEPR